MLLLASALALTRVGALVRVCAGRRGRSCARRRLGLLLGRQDDSSSSGRRRRRLRRSGGGGTGKTYGIEQKYAESKEDVLWLVPTNKPRRRLEKAGWKHVWTTAKFMGSYLDGGQWKFRMPEKIPEVKFICVDEFFQNTCMTQERVVERLLSLGVACAYTSST